MLNNEFRLIGTVVSDFEKGGSETFVKYFMEIEVERKKKNAPSIYKVVVYESNKSIDVSNSLKGKQIIAQGYLDEYKGNIQLILQDIVVVGGGVVTAEESKIDNINLDVELPNDDLPF